MSATVCAIGSLHVQQSQLSWPIGLSSSGWLNCPSNATRKSVVEPIHLIRHGPHTLNNAPMPSDSVVTCPVQRWAAERLEPCAGKLACTVLRGEHAGNGVFLPDVRREVAYIIVSPTHKAGDETGRSVGRSLPVHASLATASCEATGTTYWIFRSRRSLRRSDVTCEHQRGWNARLSGMVNASELLQASLCMTSQRC